MRCAPSANLSPRSSTESISSCSRLGSDLAPFYTLEWLENFLLDLLAEQVLSTADAADVEKFGAQPCGGYPTRRPQKCGLCFRPGGAPSKQHKLYVSYPCMHWTCASCWEAGLLLVSDYGTDTMRGYSDEKLNQAFEARTCVRCPHPACRCELTGFGSKRGLLVPRCADSSHAPEPTQAYDGAPSSAAASSS